MFFRVHNHSMKCVLIHDQTSIEYLMDEELVEKQLRLPEQVKKSENISCVLKAGKRRLGTWL